MHRSTALANGLLMIAILAGGAGMSGYVLMTPSLRSAITKPLPTDDYVNGHLTSTIESDYKTQLPLKSPSVDLLNVFTLSLFGEGRKGVVVGDKGWLFTAEEYNWTPTSAANLDANLAHIDAVARELKQRGISLEIALVPEKADIYGDLLRKGMPTEEAGEYEAVRQRLIDGTGAPVPDLRQALAAASGKEEVFFPTDTHWTVAGAGIAAAEVAKAFPAYDAVPQQAFTLKPDSTVQHAGDLLNFLELGPFSGLLPKTDTAVVPVVAVASGGSVDDFLGNSSSDASPEVALVGTSYSAIKLWSFEAQLKAALNRDVLNLAEEGMGPIEPMDKFMGKLRAGSLGAKAVIWEMPIRYLGNPSAGAPPTGKSSV